MKALALTLLVFISPWSVDYSAAAPTAIYHFEAPGGYEAWYQVSREFAREMGLRPAVAGTLDRSQKKFREWAEGCCGMEVGYQDLLIYTDIPLGETIDKIETENVEVLCHCPPDLTDGKEETYMLVVRGGVVPETLRLSISDGRGLKPVTLEKTK